MDIVGVLWMGGGSTRELYVMGGGTDMIIWTAL